jgi:hypothetical protein
VPAAADTAVRRNWALPPVGSVSPPPRVRELNPLRNADASVNLVHMELFYHFTQVTIQTLAFTRIWTELIALSFHVRAPSDYPSLPMNTPSTGVLPSEGGYPRRQAG